MVPEWRWTGVVGWSWFRSGVGRSGRVELVPERRWSEWSGGVGYGAALDGGGGPGWWVGWACARRERGCGALLVDRRCAAGSSLDFGDLAKCARAGVLWVQIPGGVARGPAGLATGGG